MTTSSSAAASIAHERPVTSSALYPNRSFAFRLHHRTRPSASVVKATTLVFAAGLKGRDGGVSAIGHLSRLLVPPTVDLLHQSVDTGRCHGVLGERLSADPVGRGPRNRARGPP